VDVGWDHHLDVAEFKMKLLALKNPGSTRLTKVLHYQV